MNCYRIYTEDINRTAILKEANKRFPCGYTFLTGLGCWKGSQEPCLIIEVLQDPAALATIQRLAADIKRINNQDSVLITETKLSFSELV